MSFKFEATFSMERWHGVPNNWVECAGIRLESNIGLSIIIDMCKALLAAGHADGSIAFYEDGFQDPSYTYPSIHDIVVRATTPVETPPGKKARPLLQPKLRIVSNMPTVSKATSNALIQLRADPHAWNRLHGRTRSILMDGGFVSVDNDVLEFTDLGNAVLTGTVDNDTYPININQADKDQLAAAAKAIGLKAKTNLARTLTFIEANVTKYSLIELEERAWKVKVTVKMGRNKTDIMKKRRVLAAIANAEKLAEAL